MPKPTHIKRKIKKYEKIQANHRMAFNMLYYHASRALYKLEQQIEKELGKKPPHKIRHTLNRLQHKLEQMAAKTKSPKSSALIE